MKKTLLPLAAGILLLMGCNKNTSSHYTEIGYPSSHFALVLADQKTDSIVFSSTDSWTLSWTDHDWCSIDPEDTQFTNKYGNAWVVQRIILTFQPNTTGKARQTTVKIDGGESSNFAMYGQVGFLGITRPTRIYANDLSSDTIVSLTMNAGSEQDSVAFKVFGDWTLTPKDGSWLTLSRTSGAPGSQLVYITPAENASTEERRDTLLLTSNGVVDFIPLIQKGVTLSAQ